MINRIHLYDDGSVAFSSTMPGMEMDIHPDGTELAEKAYITEDELGKLKTRAKDGFEFDPVKRTVKSKNKKLKNREVFILPKGLDV